MGIAERKAREFKRREEEILQASYDLFLKKGIENVTIEMIANAAEIGKGTIYKHFVSKHEILASLFLQHINSQYDELKSVDQNLPMVDRINQIFEIYIKHWFRDQEHSKVYNQCLNHLTLENLSPVFLEKVKNAFLKQHQFHFPMLEKAIADGIIIDADPFHITMIVYGVLEGLSNTMTSNYFGQQVQNQDRLFDLMKQVLLNGFLK